MAAEKRKKRPADVRQSKAEPAASGETGGSPSEPAAESRARKTRRCRFLIVAGSGFEPEAGTASELRQQFEDAHADGLDYGPAEKITTSLAPWPADDLPALKVVVREFAAARCEQHGVPYDEKRLLIRDCRDDENRVCAVAAFFPLQSYWDSQPTGAAAIVGQIRALATRIATRLAAMPAKSRRVIGGGVAVLLLACVVVPFLLPGGGGADGEIVEDESGEPEGGDGTGDPAAAAGQKPELPPVPFPTGLVRIYTQEPGFHVLVNGNPVLDAEGQLVATPCAVTAQQGAWPVTLFREGWIDLSRVVEISEDGEITLEPSPDDLGAGSDYLRAPHRAAVVGQSIELKSLNSRSAELCPSVTPDGLSIWFAADRSDGRGIYVATRISALHNFEEPRLVSRSTDLPATPSVTDDGLYVVYAVPEKARLIALSRPNPLADFGDREFLPYAKSLAPTWASAQILGDGTRIYWTEFTDKGVRTLGASRIDRDVPFGKWFKVTMPGTHPAMSQDGLRQYVFSEGRLTRYRRTSTTQRFVEEKVIGQLDLANYSASRQHRQFCVSNDEQWMFYCDDPLNRGDLYMVRLAETPQWGIAPRGKSIPEKMAVAEMTPTSEEMVVAPEAAPPKPVDPRSLPLPYTSHWKVFQTLMASRQYEEVAASLLSARSNDQLKPNAEQLQWDSADFEAIQKFWSDLEQGVAGITAGDQMRLGTLRFDFVRYEAGEIIGKRSETEIRRTLKKLSPSELSSLFDRFMDKDDAQSQYRFAVFLSYESDTIERARDQRLEKAGALADEFHERQARRVLVQAVAELERSNFGRGVEFLKAARSMADGTPVANEALSLEEKLYDYIKWSKRGSRQWQMDPQQHSYAATLERSDGSLLVSEEQYENFELSLEWMTDNAPTAQGGVYFRYTGSGLLIDNAFKVHLASDYGIAADMYCTGSLFGSEPPTENAAKPAGEWNTLNMRVLGEDVVITINGRKVLDSSAKSDTIPKKGFVCLDGVTGGITYRRILISELPAP